MKTIESWNAPVAKLSAQAGEVVGFTLDEQIFAERGDIGEPRGGRAQAHERVPRQPVLAVRAAAAPGDQLKLKVGPDEATVTIDAIESAIDTQTLARKPVDAVGHNEVAEVVLRTREMLSLDDHRTSEVTGRFVLVDGFDTVPAA